MSARRALNALYEGVPATTCAGTGECCQLTDEEYDGYYATMFPLYRVEYCLVLEYLQLNFPKERAAQLTAHREERPRRCPFLGTDNGCTIYPARPLICRTYGVMNHDTIAAAAVRCMGRVPDDWLKRFTVREGCMVCPRVRVLEQEKLEVHADRLVDFTYERELTRLSQEIEIGDAEQRRAFTASSGMHELPLRWSFGGFNCVQFGDPRWLRTGFKEYWQNAVLADAG